MNKSNKNNICPVFRVIDFDTPSQYRSSRNQHRRFPPDARRYPATAAKLKYSCELEHTGFAVVASITGTIRNMKLEVVLSEKTLTKGSVLIHQMKSLDFIDRQIELIVNAPLATTEKVTSIAKAIIQ